MYPKFMGGTFIHAQAKCLMDSGCELKVVVPAAYCPDIMTKINKNRWSGYAAIPEQDTIDDVPVYYPRYFRLPGKWFHPLSCYAQYAGLSTIAHKLINEFKPDVIHAHAATAAGFAGLLLKNKYDLPLVCSIRGSDINAYPYYAKGSLYLTKKVIEGADRIVSVSNALKKAANAIAKPKREIQVVYNGCDFTHFSFRKADRLSLRSRFNIPGKDRILLFIGSVSAEKGIVELVAAFKQAAEGVNGVRLFIAGGGWHPAVEKIIADARLKDKIHVLGPVAHHEVPGLLNAADIFILPSHSEGLPNVVLEAMACGLPIIATRVGGIPEAVEDGKSGILVEKQDVASLTRAIKYMVENKDEARQMGILGRIIIESRFLWKDNAKQIIDIYRGIR